MPLDTLPAKLVVYTRAQKVQKFLRDLTNRNPAALTYPGTEPDLDANVFADATAVHSANAVTIASGVTRATATGTQLDDWAARLGTKRLPATGAAGAVIATTGSSGSTILAGDVLVHPATGLRFQCSATSTYANGAQVPINGIDVGPSTNLPAGTVLNWQAPRPGCGQSATVALQADGSGLSGGNLVESDDQLKARLDYIAANPPASGNDAQYQAQVAITPLLSVQQCFTFNSFYGPGSIGVAFTLRQSQTGANRIPNATQIAQVLSFLGGVMPADDGIYGISLVASPVTVVLKVLWAVGAASWADGTTWPPYVASPNLVSAGVPASGAITPTTFRLSSSGLSSSTAPVAGQSIAFLDLPNLTFRRKRFLSVTTISATQYDVTVDTTQGISDAGYAPSNGQACCPWSDSLGTALTPVLAYFDTLGPGEMFTTFFDPGLRQRRSPLSPQYWPSVITNRLIGGAAAPVPASGASQNLPPVQTLLTTPTLQDVVLQEPAIPFVTPVGTPAVSVNLLTLGNLLAFPE